MAQPSSEKFVVLVLDDEDSVREMLVKCLSKMYNVYAARDGIEALELLNDMPTPNAIVCDVMMPRMDGFQFAQQIKTDAALKQVPFLFLTAKTWPLDVVQGINLGARHYITKPFKITDLVSKLAKLLKR